MEKSALFVGEEKGLKAIKEDLSRNYVINVIDSTEKIIPFLERNNVDLILMSSNGVGVDWNKIIEPIKRKEEFKYLPIVFVEDTSDLKIEHNRNEYEGADTVATPVDECSSNFEEILREKTKMIENLQDVMFMSIAELVECRDEITGGHVKRTAKYVEVLVKALVERKVYPDVLVPSYVRDMIRSAPLHDLGKIGIDDKTLLKNGSLDQEEFEFMKTHSALGGKAIQKMIDQTTEGSFLDVAKDMANYHHEKWDGSGYPEGLKGEEIPVSARVMAIADIYDALTTKRPYKDGWSHEDAVRIITNEMTSSFDPAILSVFKEIHLEFAKIKQTLQV